MREVVTGVWHWKAEHPEWNSRQTWNRMVSSNAVDTGEDVVAGDTLIDRGNGLEVHPDWPVEAVTAEHVIQRLRPLLDLPVDVVLPTHADPADRAALERALS
jgi:hypothetical protein